MGARMLNILSVLAFFLACIRHASAATTSDSPVGSGRVGFVVGNDRSTMDIIWSCLGTIFTCVWVAQHPDLIRANDPTMPKGLTQLKFCRMFPYILAPEYLVQAALSEWWTARQFTSTMRAKGCTHWTTRHSFLVLMKGLSYTTHDSNQSRILTTSDVEDLNPQHLDQLVVKCLDEEIDDKDKSDVLAKVLACIQIVYTIIKATARVRQHLPLSELEVTTFAYILCTLFSYIFWWSKPQEIRRPIVIKLRKPHFQRSRSVGNYNMGTLPIYIIGILGFGTAVGAIHLLAWNFSFPTTTELWVWRSTSLCVTVLPLIVLSVIWLLDCFPGRHPRGNLAVLAPLLILYGSARLLLLAQSLASFRSLPKEVYKADWAELGPHL
jgi:hypothetical protein